MSLLRKVRVAVTPRSWHLKTRLSNGAVVYGRNRAGYGGRGIYVHRDAIEPEFQQLERFLGPTGVFVDVGANTGIYALKAAKHYNNSGTVLAVEPFPDVAATLYRSIQANGFTNVRLRNLCAGDRTGARTLWMNSARPNTFSLVERSGDARGLPVLAVSLDNLFGWEHLNRLDYLKIDAEGAEREILSGAAKIIEKYRPIVQAEVSARYFAADLPSYSIFRTRGSPNVVYMPDEHPKARLPGELGWNKIENQA